MIRALSCLLVLIARLAFAAPVCTPVTEGTTVEKALNFLGPAGATGTVAALLLKEGNMRSYVGGIAAVATALGTWYTWQSQGPRQPQAVCEPDHLINGKRLKIVGSEPEVRAWFVTHRTSSTSLLDQYAFEYFANLPQAQVPSSAGVPARSSCEGQVDMEFNRLIGRIADKTGRPLRGIVVQAAGEVERSIERVTLTDQNGCYQFQFHRRSYDFGRLFYVSAYGNGYSRSNAQEQIAETNAEPFSIELEPAAIQPFFSMFRSWPARAH